MSFRRLCWDGVDWGIVILRGGIGGVVNGVLALGCLWGIANIVLALG